MGLSCSSLGTKLPVKKKKNKLKKRAERSQSYSFYSPFPVALDFEVLKYSDPSRGLADIDTLPNQSNCLINGSDTSIIISNSRVKNSIGELLTTRSNSVDKRIYKSVSFQEPLPSEIFSSEPKTMNSSKLNHIGCYSPKTPIEADPTDTVVVQARLILASPSESVHEISLFVEKSYSAGSLVSVKPENCHERVKQLLNLYDIMQPDDYFSGLTNKPQTYRDFVTKTIDLSAPPTPEILQLIRKESGLPPSIQSQLGSYQSWIENDKPDILTVLEAIVKDKIPLPSLELLFTHLPRITSRLYYITSVEPGVVTLNVRRIHVGDRLGLASNYLTTVRPKDHVIAEILPYTTLQAPPLINQPIVVITSGFGITAVRHLWENRKKERHTGSISILYNVKSLSSILYKSELISRNSAGFISDLLYFTGEPTEAVDRMGNDLKVVRLIGQKLSANGCIYVTGPEEFCLEVRRWIQEALNCDNIRDKDWYKEDCGSYKVV